MTRADLRDVTFLVPIRIDSPERAFNVRTVLSYLRRHLDAPVIVQESGPKPLVPNLFAREPDAWAEYHFERTDDPIFHRMRLLNTMLCDVRTSVVVNYDADVLLRPEAYSEAATRVREGHADLVYPYARGETQRKVRVPKPYAGEDLFDPKFSEPWPSAYGFAQFFSIAAYRDGGMENEGFVSYGPEDVERGERFQRLGYRVEWLSHAVWHLEHPRGPNSGPANPHFRANEALLRRIREMTVEELRAYYASVPYRRKYAHA